jgi:membrane protease YdiL (CAAX protease family)
VSQRARIASYLVLTFALSTYFYVRIAADGRMRPATVLGLMWCPGAAALIIRLVTQRNVRGEGWRLPAARWLLRAYVIPILASLVVYGFAWLSGVGSLDVTALRLGTSARAATISPGVSFIVLATVGFLQASFMFALGEEIGWSGFLIPELAKTASFAKTVAITGAAWGVYHYPVILFADYHSAAPRWFGLITFTGGLFASAALSTWLRLRSGSLWPSVVLHGSHNLFVQTVFDKVTIDGPWTPYLTTEFGVGLAIAYAIIALLCVRTRV